MGSSWALKRLPFSSPRKSCGASYLRIACLGQPATSFSILEKADCSQVLPELCNVAANR